MILEKKIGSMEYDVPNLTLSFLVDNDLVTESNVLQILKMKTVLI